MRILVTGSNGCVGNALQSLKKESSCWIFSSRSDCNLVDRDEALHYFCKIKPDFVIHLAGVVPGFYNINRVASFSDNVRINENVLEACNFLEIERSLFCLSINMFPEMLSGFPIVESMIFDGALSGAFSGYAYAKRMLALQIQNYNEQYGRKYFGIIPCNIYGPNDNFNSGRLIPNILLKFKEAMKNNSDVTINGTGEPLRQFIYSLDLAKIIEFLTYNYFDTKPIICSGDEEISIWNLVYMTKRIMEFKNNITFDISKPDGSFRKTVSNSYLKSIMKGVSFTKLEDGLRETILSLE